MATIKTLKWETFDATDRSTSTTGVTSVYPSIITIKAEKSRTASGLKDFYSKIASGEDATTGLTAYDIIIDKYVVGRVRASISGTKRKTDWTHKPSQTIPDISLVTAGMVNEARANAYGYLNSFVSKTYSEFQGQVFAGELRETVDFLRDPLGAMIKLVEELIKALIELKKGRLPKKDLAKAISDLWLQFRFGILPLASDIDDIIAIINDTSKKTLPKRRRFYGFAESATTSVANRYSTGVNGIYRNREVITHRKAECFLHAGVMFSHKIENFTEQSGALLRFFEGNEIPSTLWELTPFSFLVDYFSNVGSIIESATQSYADFVYISESIVKTVAINESNSSYIITPTSAFDTLDSVIPAVSRIKKRTVDRTSSASAIPPLHVGLPGKPVQYLNMLALLVSLSS